MINEAVSKETASFFIGSSTNVGSGFEANYLPPHADYFARSEDITERKENYIACGANNSETDAVTVRSDAMAVRSKETNSMDDAMTVGNDAKSVSDKEMNSASRENYSGTRAMNTTGKEMDYGPTNSFSR